MKGKWKRTLALMLAVVIVFTSISFDSAASEPQAVEAENTQLTTATEEEATGTEESGTPDVDKEENETPGTDEGEGENPGTNEGEGQTPGTDEGESQTPGTNEGEGENPGTNEGEGENPGTNEGEEGQTPVEGEETETPVTEEEIPVEAVEELAEEPEMVLEEEEMVRAANVESPKFHLVGDKVPKLGGKYAFQLTWNSKSGWKRLGDTKTVDGKPGILLKEASKDKKYGVRYYNVGMYNDQMLDLEVTLKNWSSDNYLTGKKSEPAVGFTTGSIGCYSKDIKAVRFEFTFYKSGTNTKVNVCGNFTFRDIDGTQELAFNPDDFAEEHAYYLKEGYLTEGKKGGWHYVDVKDNKLSEVLDKTNWVTATFGGNGGKSSFRLEFRDGRGVPKDKNGKELKQEFCYFGLGTASVVNVPLEAPLKFCDKPTVSGNDFDVSAITYTIVQKMPDRYDDDLKKYVLTDELDSCIHVRGHNVNNVKVYDAANNDVTNRFDITIPKEGSGSRTVTISAKKTALEKDSFYGTTYYFEIPVRITAGVDIRAHNHITDEKTHTFQIPNKAEMEWSSSVYSDPAPKTTNTVKFTRRLPACSFLKVDGNGQAIKNNPATFTIYSDAACKTKVGEATCDSASGKYTIPPAVWGKIAVNNNRYYYMKETHAPKGYMPKVKDALYTITVLAENGGITISGDGYADGKIVNVKEQPLTITKTGSEPEYVAKGDIIQYTLTVTNPNPMPYEVTVRDTLDSKVTAGSFTVDGTKAGYNWNGSYKTTIAANKTLTIVINATVNRVYNTDYIDSSSEFDRNSNIISNRASLSYTTYSKNSETVYTNTVFHYLQPRMDYTITKTRTRNPASGRNGWGFLPNDGDITYSVTVKNTYGDIPMNMTISDRFDNYSYFTFSGSSTQSVTNLTSSQTLIFKAKVNEGTPGTIGDGYRNVAQAAGVWANYRDPKTGNTRQLTGTSKEAYAYTPVAPALYKYDSVTGKLIQFSASEDQPVFKLYTDEGCTSMKPGFTDCTYVFQTGGIFLPTMENAEAGTYYLKEISAPKGYNLSNTVYRVYISDNTVSVRPINGGVASFDGKIYNTPGQEPTITKTTRTNEYVKKGQEIIYDLIVTNANDEPYPVTVKDTLDNTKLQAGSYCIDDGASKGTWGGSTKVTVPANGSTKITIHATVKADYNVDFINNSTTTNRNSNMIRNKASMTYTVDGNSKTAETAEVLHYLEPTVSYMLTKARTTEPSSTWGFFPGDGTQISYNATVINTSTVPINVTLEDEFTDATYFTFTNGNTASVNGLPAKNSAVRTFQATVKKGTPAKVNVGSGHGYKNTVTASATATYRDAKTGLMKTTSAIEKEAVAYTPVAPELYKYDSQTKQPVSGTPVFKVFSDAACTNELAECGYDSNLGRILLPDISYVASGSRGYTGYIKETAPAENYILSSTVYKIFINPSAGTVTLTNAATGEAFDGIIYNTRDVSSRIVMDLTKTGSAPQVVKKGDIITYTIDLSVPNSGSGHVTFNISDEVPEGLEIIEVNRGSYEGRNWKDSGTMYVGTRLRYTIQAKVVRDYVGTGTAEDVWNNILLNQARVTYTAYPANGEIRYDSTASQIVTHYLRPEVDFEITKERVTPYPSSRSILGFAREDGNIEYKVTLTNTGNLPLSLDVSDVFADDDVFEFVGDNHIKIENLAAGASKDVYFYAKVSENAQGSSRLYENTVTANATATYVDPLTRNTETLTLEKSATAQTKIAPYFYKYDSQTNKPLTGASKPPVFQVYRDEECTKLYNTARSTYDSDTGKIVIPNISYSSGTWYYLKETQAPDGYYLSDKIYKFRLTNSGFELLDAESNQNTGYKIYNDRILPTITKTCDTDGQYVKKGSRITYKITVTNPSAIQYYFSLTDELDPRLTWVKEGSDIPENGKIGFGLNPGETRILTIVAEVNTSFDPNYKYDSEGNAAANTIPNQAFMSYFSGTDSGTAETDIIKHYLQPEISYEVTKQRMGTLTSTWGFLPGDEITYQATVKNTGEIPIDVELSDVFDEQGNFTFTSADKTTISNIAPNNGTGTATFTATINEGTQGNVKGIDYGDLANAGYRNVVTATATAEYRDPKDDTLKTLTAGPRTAEARTPVAPMLYKYDRMTDLPLVTDAGNDPEFKVYQDIDCTDELTEFLTYNHNAGRIELNYSTPVRNFLAGMGSTPDTLYIKETHAPDGYYVDDKAVYKIVRGEDGSITFQYNDEPIDRIYNEPLNYDVTIIKTGSNPKYVQKGDMITYTLMVTNPHSVDVKVKVTDTLDEKLQAGKWSIDGHEQTGDWSGSCELTARANSNTEIQIQAEVIKGYDASPENKDELKAKNTITNIALLDIYRNDGTTEPEPKKTPPVEHYLTPKTGLEIQKELVTPTPNRPGGEYGFIPKDGELAYQVTITNTGEVPLTVSLEDVYEEDGIFEFVGPDVIENIELPVGETKVQTFTAKLTESAPGAFDPYINKVTARANGTYIDPQDGTEHPVYEQEEAEAGTPVAAYFYKVDSRTDEPVINPATEPEFKVYSDKECTQEVVSHNHYPAYFFYDSATGRVYLPDKLYFDETPGTYYIKETTAPTGYVKSDEVYTLTINEKGQYESITDSEGNDIGWRLKNAPEGPCSLEFVKVDADTEEALSNAVFRLYELNCTSKDHIHDTDIIDVDNIDVPGSEWTLVKEAISSPGVYFDNLEWEGIYQLVEVTAPYGYLPSVGQWRITFDRQKNPVIQAIEKDGQMPLAFMEDEEGGLLLPNRPVMGLASTGGFGARMYHFGGLLLMALAVLWQALVGRKRKSSM